MVSAKRLDISVVRRALKRASAVIVLAEPLAHDFAPGVPFLVMEGLFNGSTGRLGDTVASTPRRSIVYAGGLLEEYGVKNLVEGFRSLPDVDLKLELYGKGALEKWLGEQAETDSRIEPPRLVAPQELHEIELRCLCNPDRSTRPSCHTAFRRR